MVLLKGGLDDGGKKILKMGEKREGRSIRIYLHGGIAFALFFWLLVLLFEFISKTRESNLSKVV